MSTLDTHTETDPYPSQEPKTPRTNDEQTRTLSPSVSMDFALLDKTPSNVHFSSLRLDWQTPDWVYFELDDEFHFDFDPCPVNPDFDGLSESWDNSNFVNPPYGREIGKWLKKGYEESLLGKTVVFLIPSRTDTIWWHEYVMQADEIRFIKGRLRFKGAINSAPFPSCVVVFNG